MRFDTKNGRKAVQRYQWDQKWNQNPTFPSKRLCDSYDVISTALRLNRSKATNVTA